MLFTIDSTTGALAFRSAPDFETPLDSGDTAANNTYVVTISATDSSGNVSTQTLTVTVTNVVELLPQTITFPAIADQLYPCDDITLTASASSGLSVTYSVVSGPATVSGNTLTITGTGSVTVQATQAGNSTYTAANPVSRSFAVTAGTYTLTWSTPDPIQSGTALSGVQLNAVASIAGSYSYTPALGAVLSPGSHTLTVQFTPTNPAYATQTASVTLIVRGAPNLAMPAAMNVSARNAAEIAATTGSPVTVDHTANEQITVEFTVEDGDLALTDTHGASLAATPPGILRLTGTLEQINQALGGLTYIPANASAEAFSVVAIHGIVTDSRGLSAQALTNVIIDRELLGGTSRTFSVAGIIPDRASIARSTVLSWDQSILSQAPFVSADGKVTIYALEGQDGTSESTTITVQFEFSDGTTRQETIPVTIYRPLLQEIQAPTILNPQTSLYEQSIRIINTTPFSLISFSLSVPDLAPGASMVSASGLKADGTPFIAGLAELPPNAEQTLIVEYFSNDVRAFAAPTVRLLIASSDVLPKPEGTLLPATDVRSVRGYLDRTYVQFFGRAGFNYWVQYRDSPEAEWVTSTMPILGLDQAISWMDHGAPKTNSPPTANRSYQVLASPAAVSAALSAVSAPAPAAAAESMIQTTPAGSSSRGNSGGGALSWPGLIAMVLVLGWQKRRRLTSALAAAIFMTPLAPGRTFDHQVGVSLMAPFMIEVENSLAGFDLGLPPLAAGVDHHYLDGYNRVDSSGNQGDNGGGLPSRTAFFGYDQDRQVDLAADTLTFHALSSLPAAPFDRSRVSGLSPRLEFNYTLVRRGKNGHAGRWGFEFRAGQIHVAANSAAAQSVQVGIASDAYALGSVVPPPAPYRGAYQVLPFTPRIGDSPTRTLLQYEGEVTGSRVIVLDGWILRLGAIWRFRSTVRSQSELRAGPAWVDTKIRLNFDSNLVLPNVGRVPLFTQSSQRRAVPGLYAGFTHHRRLSEHWNLDLSADLLATGALTVRAGRILTRVNLSPGALVGAGISRHF